MSHPTTSSESSTSVGPHLRRQDISWMGAEDRNVPSFRALFEKPKAYFATEGDGR